MQNGVNPFLIKTDTALSSGCLLAHLCNGNFHVQLTLLLSFLMYSQAHPYQLLNRNYPSNRVGPTQIFNSFGKSLSCTRCLNLVCIDTQMTCTIEGHS
jgi:hypothetical protein